MRLLLCFLLYLIVASDHAQAQSAVPSSDEILEPAFAKAAAEEKNVMVIFHASWCGWCRKMDASLQDDAVKPLMDKSYEIVHLTVYESSNKKHLENKGALSFLSKLGGADKGLPYWYILDKERKVLADSQYKPGKNSGCPATEEEVAYFINVVKRTSALTDEELDIIRKRFRQNDR